MENFSKYDMRKTFLPAKTVETIREDSRVLREGGVAERTAEGGVWGGRGASGAISEPLLRKSSRHCLCLYSF